MFGGWKPYLSLGLTVVVVVVTDVVLVVVLEDDGFVLEGVLGTGGLVVGVAGTLLPVAVPFPPGVLLGLPGVVG